MIQVYIFLDIDGVLNCKADWNKPYTINNKCLDNFVKLCKDLSKKYGVVKIVLTSSWKEGFDIKGNNSPQITGLLHKLNIYGLVILDKTMSVSGKSRQDEIEYYIRRNGINDYIILDDDKSLYTDISKVNIYITDYLTGLTDKDTKKVLKQVKRR